MDTYVALGAGLSMGLAALGAGIGQGVAAYAALSGTARNPSAAGRIQTQLVMSLALIESIAVYGLIIAFLMQGKID